jgi:hypothetical protein
MSQLNEYSDSLPRIYGQSKAALDNIDTRVHYTNNILSHIVSNKGAEIAVSNLNKTTRYGYRCDFIMRYDFAIGG